MARVNCNEDLLRELEGCRHLMTGQELELLDDLISNPIPRKCYTAASTTKNGEVLHKERTPSIDWLRKNFFGVIHD